MAHMPLTDARALLARVAEKETRLAADVVNDPKWLVLPLALRNELLRRHSALEAYAALDRPASTDVDRHAAEIGMKRVNFLKLFADWAEGGRTPLALIPYQGLRGGRSSRMANPETATAIRTLIDEVLSREPMAAPRVVIKHVKDNWSGPGKLPSDVTLRNFHDKAIGERRPAPGTLTINFSNSPQEDAVVATTFGEVIVIDHTAPSGVLVDGKTMTTPTVTLAIDLWSGTPIGVATTEGEPGPHSAAEALWDAQRRLQNLFPSERTIRPKILYASTFDHDWDNFRGFFLKHDFDLIERRDVRLHHGGPTKRIIGSKLGELHLQPKLAGRRHGKGGSVDVEANTVLTLSQIHHVVEVGVLQMLHDRFEDLERDLGVWLDLPTVDEVIEDWGDHVLVGRRAPTVDVGKVLDEVRAMLEKSGATTEIKERDDERREYRITVRMAPEDADAEAWLELAEDALELRDRHGIYVRFDLEADEGLSSSG
jgi:hypothetical protein